SVQLDRSEPRNEFGEHEPYLHPRQCIAEAHVRAPLAERQMINVGTGDVEPVRIGEDRIVPIARGKPQDYFVARIELLATQPEVPSRRKTEVVERRGPP